MGSRTFNEQIERIKRTHNRYRFFFVVGAPKSGTTWLQKALDAHSQICCAGEGHFGDMFFRPLRKILEEYYRHQRIVVRNVYEGNGYYQQALEESFQFLIKSFVVDAFSRLRIPDGTLLIGDKTPVNIEYLNLLHRLFPEARFVNIVRDGRDTLASVLKHGERVLKGKKNADDIEQFLLERTGTYISRWVRSLERVENFAERHKDLLHSVRYEDLKTDFPATFSSVLGFLDVSDKQHEIETCRELSSFERLSGGRKPGEEDPNAFVRKGVVGDWRSVLTRQHLSIFDDQAGAWLDRYGYER